MTKISPRDYLVEFIKIVREFSIRNADLHYENYSKPAIDWDEYERDLWNKFELANPTHIQSDEMNALIHTALNNLDDGHSSFAYMTHAQRKEYRQSLPYGKDTPYSEIIDKTAYLRLPSEIPQIDNARNFTENVRSTLIRVDAEDIDGWIIDLRANYGGNLWGALSGIWPLLPDEPAGYFVKPDQEPHPFGFHDKKGKEWKDYLLPNYDLKSKGKPIAVLIGNGTNSAGEIIAIAFRGLQNTKSFGSETNGKSTSNGVFSLPDERIIALTMYVMADRTGQAYGGKIAPDTLVQGNYDHIFDGHPVDGKGYDPKKDNVVLTAMNWVADQSPKQTTEPAPQKGRHP